MKRIISFLLILALLICLVACGNDGESSSSESQAEQSSTETQSESMESESVTESETQGNTSSESTTESESQSQSTESVTESETNSQSSETATESEIESEVNSESESESTTESETESEIGSESSTETESETESESESESQNPTTVAELTQKMSRQVNDVFNQHFLDDVLKTGRFSSLDASKISNAKWVAKGENEITDVDFVFHYGNDDGKLIYIINLKFSRNITIDEIIDNASTLTAITTTRTQQYMFDYIPTIQGTRDDLVNALFKAVGVNEVGGPRYFKDNGQSALIDGLGMAHGFTFVEVGENEVNEYTIYVNVASDDAGYVNKLNNPSEYKITRSQVIDISGASVEYVAQ